MNDTSNRTPDNVASFVARLERLRDEGNRGALATLRRSLSNPGRDFSAYTVIGAHLSLAPSRNVDDFVLVASLFAFHPLSIADGRSLGASLRVLRARLDGGEDSLDLMVAAVLNADDEDIPVRIRHVISRLASKEVPVDYRRLLRDLVAWSHPDRYVQKRWAKDYWVGTPVDDATDTDTSPSTMQTEAEQQ